MTCLVRRKGLGGRLTEFFGVLYKVKSVNNVVGIFECKINDLWACMYVYMLEKKMCRYLFLWLNIYVYDYI